MNFNTDPNKQAQEVIFSSKLPKSTHPTLSFHNNTVTQSVTQKPLGMLLDTKLDFQGHFRSGIQRSISPKLRIYPIQLSSSYNRSYKRDVYRETLQ